MTWVVIDFSDNVVNTVVSFTEETEAWEYAAVIAHNSIEEEYVPEDDWKELEDLFSNGQWEKYVDLFNDLDSDYNLEVHRCTPERVDDSETAEASSLQLSINFVLPHPVKPEVLSWALEGVDKMEESLKAADSAPTDASVTLAWVDAKGNIVKDTNDLIEEILKGQDLWKKV